jgi:hypothetical protein
MGRVPSDAQHQQHAQSRDPAGPAPAGIGPGTILDERYRLSGPLGQGGTATVYRATDVLLGRSVAVKVFHPHLTDPTMLARQRREMRVVAEVHHPHLVTIHDARVGSTGHTTNQGGMDRARPSYLVMEFVDGLSLAQRLTGASLSPDEVVCIGVGIAGALQVLHGRELVHRDVKPGNILLTSAGVAKLSDFGIAKMLNAERVTNSADVVGTAPYLSPEQARGGDVGPPTDIYALGLVLLECLTGQREFPGPAVEAAVARLLRDPVVPDTMPAPWPALLRSMTSREPGERPTAQDVVTTLTGSSTEPAYPPRPAVTSTVAPGASTNLTGGGPLPGAATRVLRVRPDRSRRWKLIMIAAVLAAAGILTITALTLTGVDPAPAPPATNPTDAGRTGISAAPTPSVVAPAAGSATPGPDGPAAPVVTEPDPTTSIAPPPTTTQATSADTTLSAESPPDATDPAITNPNEPKGKDKDPKTNGNNGEPKKTKQNNGR